MSCQSKSHAWTSAAHWSPSGPEITLAGMDAKDVWAKFEPRVHDFERKAGEAANRVGEEFHKIGYNLEEELSKLRDRVQKAKESTMRKQRWLGAASSHAVAPVCQLRTTSPKLRCPRSCGELVGLADDQAMGSGRGQRGDRVASVIAARPCQ